METGKLINEAIEYVSSLFKEKVPANMGFHNINHVLEVLHAAEFIANKTTISETELDIVRLAAIFHDSGYAETYIGHEEAGMKIARNFLQQYNCAEEIITEVEKAIQATKYPQSPTTLCAEILCDADLFHFTRPDYPAYEQALRNEHSIYLKKIYTDEEWNRNNKEFMLQHHYFTAYAKEVLQPFKKINEERVKSCLADHT